MKLDGPAWRRVRSALALLAALAFIVSSCSKTRPGAGRETDADVTGRLTRLEASQTAILKALQAIRSRLDRLNGPTGAGFAGVGGARLAGRTVSLDQAPLKGNRSARVAIVEYSDFQCPFCRMFVRNTLPALEREYVDSGKVLLAFRHLPLMPLHPDALRAGEAADCAFGQDRFWEMHDALFSGRLNLKEDGLMQGAREAGLDLDGFKSCLEGLGTVRVRQDLASARALGLGGTPAFLVGTMEADGSVKVAATISGAKPFDEFKAAIDPLLADAVR